MAKTILTLRSTTDPTLPGEVQEFDYVGAVMGGGKEGFITIFNDDPVNFAPDGQPVGGPKPFLMIAADRVYSITTPENNRPPLEQEKPVRLVVPQHLANARH